MSDSAEAEDAGIEELIGDESLQRILQNKLDEIDYEIFQALNQNGRISDTELGERVGLSRTAARRRRKKLQDEGILKILGVLVLQEADLAYADVWVKTSADPPPEEIESFIQRLLHEELIYEVDEYMGDYDLLVRVWHGSLKNVKQYTEELFQNSRVVDEYQIEPVIRTRKAWQRVINHNESE